MYVIFEHKNKQYKVSEGDILKLPKSEGLKKNDVLSFDNIVLLKNSNDQVQIGTPIIKGVSVKAKVIDQIKDKIGHRQDLTLVKIENIISSSNTKKSIPESSNKNVKKEVSDGS